MFYDFTKFFKNISIAAVIFAFAFVVLFLTTRTASAATSTNISATTTDHWAWNGIIGWMDFYQGGNSNVVVASNATTTGYASSSAGLISLDCNQTSGGGPNQCGTSNYGVYNPGNGDLVGWAWNDVYGWISFCGGGSTAECPGTVAYEVLIDTTTGDFSNYAWNDVVGWISFCGNVSGTGGCVQVSSSSYAYKVNTTWTSTSTSGYLDSSTYDTGVAGGAELNSIIWQGDKPDGTSVKFQIAASSSPSGPWDFIGPDGINSYYPKTGFGNPSSSIPLNYVLHNNQRYFRYRVVLVSNAAQTASPTVNDVIINWSP